MSSTIHGVSATYNEVFVYPDEIKDAFIKTGGLSFSDGSYVSSEQIWDFVTSEGPRRYPNLFTAGRLFGPSGDWQFLAGIKRQYLQVSLYDRLEKAINNGIPTIFVQGGQNHDPYYAAGGIPLRPAHVGAWALNLKEGLTYETANMRRQQQRESGHQKLTVDACQTAGYGIIQNGEVPIDIIAPYLCNRCSDIAFGVEAHRHGSVKLPLALVDIPITDRENKEWAIEYTAKNLQRVVALIAQKSRKKVNNEDLWKEFAFHNKKRRLAREYAHLWWNAKIPPTNSQDHTGTIGLGNESYGDPVAALQILEESIAEVKVRIARGQRGLGLSEDNPVRLFICGSCVNPNLKHTDASGGVVVGKDDGFSEVFHDVPETGDDPYSALAQTLLAYPYEQPSEIRGKWTSEQVRASRAEGVIFMHQWGCNYQSGIARLIVDVVQKETGVLGTVFERTFAESPEGHEQLNTRVETFLEVLRNTR